MRAGFAPRTWHLPPDRGYHGRMYSRKLPRSLPVMLLILLLTGPYSMSAPAPTALPDCPAKPNCISSQAGSSTHGVAPFTFTDSAVEAMHRLGTALATEPRVRIITSTPTYLHAEVRSLIFRFVDDIEFLVDAEQRVIHVRSASRIGYSDLGVNRRRVERIRRAFSQAR